MAKAVIWFAICLASFSLVTCSRPSHDAKASGIEEMTLKPLAIENGKQVVTILARGGYSPDYSTAKAGIPSILRMVTKNTFDCSRALVLPSLGIQKFLPATGTVDIQIPPMKQGTQFYGICSMGMYGFHVTFN